MKKLLLAVALMLVLTPKHAISGGFVDDFSDGNAADAPGFFTIDPVFNAGTGTVINSNFVLTTNNITSGFASVAFVSNAGTFGDVSLLTQARALTNPGPDSYFGIKVRASAAGEYFGLLQTNGLLEIGDVTAGVIDNRGSVQTSLNPLNSDVLLGLDAIGDQISLTAWAAGSPRPAPQLSLTDSQFTQGKVGIFDTSQGGGAFSTAFRSVSALAPIPEPSSFTLAALGFAGVLALAHLRRNR